MNGRLAEKLSNKPLERAGCAGRSAPIRYADNASQSRSE
jgi:hypothetical protein